MEMQSPVVRQRFVYIYFEYVWGKQDTGYDLIITHQLPFQHTTAMIHPNTLNHFWNLLFFSSRFNLSFSFWFTADNIQNTIVRVFSLSFYTQSLFFIVITIFALLLLMKCPLKSKKTSYLIGEQRKMTCSCVNFLLFIRFFFLFFLLQDDFILNAIIFFFSNQLKKRHCGVPGFSKYFNRIN